MPMSLLELVREARGRMGQPIPGSAIGNTDPTVIQCVGIFQEFLEDLINRKIWQSVTREATFTTVATESQGVLSTLFPYGFEGILPETFYNRTTILPIIGATFGAAVSSLGSIITPCDNRFLYFSTSAFNSARAVSMSERRTRADRGPHGAGTGYACPPSSYSASAMQ